MLSLRPNHKDATTRADTRDQEAVPGSLRQRRPHRGAQRLGDPRRSEPAVRQRRHGAVRAVLPGPAHPAVCHGHQHPEVHPHPRYRRGGHHHPAQHLLPDGGQLLLRRLLQAPGHRTGLDPADQPGRRGRLRVRPGAALGHGLLRRRRGRSSCGRRSPGCRRSASSAAAWPTTTGRWVFPGRAGRARRSTTTAGPDYGIEGGPEANEDRYIEIWNLVFMQNERGEGTSKEDFEILGPLPRQNIDTGMGVERIACLLQGVDNVYETDLMRPMIDTVGRGARPAATAQGSARRRRALPGHRRPQPHRGDHHRRRCHPVQRGPRLRAAPAAAPHRPRGQAAGHRAPDRRRPDGHACATRWARPTRSWSPTSTGSTASRSPRRPPSTGPWSRVPSCSRTPPPPPGRPARPCWAVRRRSPCTTPTGSRSN